MPRFVEKWAGDRQEAADLVAQGKARPNARGVVELPNGTFVQHRLEDTENLTVALIDFSDVKHNNIAEPDRTKDNSTYSGAGAPCRSTCGRRRCSTRTARRRRAAAGRHGTRR
jgi:hypothetical protein